MVSMTTKDMATAIGVNAYDLTRAIKEGMDYHRLAFKTNKAGVNGGQWIWSGKPERVLKAYEKHRANRAKSHPKTGRPKGSLSKTGRIVDNG
jgi:hypothetical protein